LKRARLGSFDETNLRRNVKPCLQSSEWDPYHSGTWASFDVRQPHPSKKSRSLFMVACVTHNEHNI
jgi:hypothetical protein